MSVAPKLAALALLIRFISVAFEPLIVNVQILLLVFAAITMVGGNLIAVSQTNVKRMLAYSSIAHGGYMLAGIAAVQSTDSGLEFTGFHTMLYYGVMYMFMNIGAFAVVFVVEKRTGSVELSSFRGLSRTNLMPALMMAAFMLSLTGVPPMAGFFGKLFIIQTLVASDLIWLAVVLVLASVVSAYFYIRVIVNMFMVVPDEADDVAPRALPDSLAMVIVLTGVATLVLGVFSNWLYDLAVRSAGLSVL